MTPQAESVLDLFRATGAYLEGHFRLTSGLHSPNYLQCALVLRHPPVAEDLGHRLAAQLRKCLGAQNLLALGLDDDILAASWISRFDIVPKLDTKTMRIRAEGLNAE